MIEEHNKNTSSTGNGQPPHPRIFDMTPDERAAAAEKDFAEEQLEQQAHQIIDLRVHEAAIDLWTYEFDTKIKLWSIEGLYRTALLALLEGGGFAKRYRPDRVSTFLVRGESVIEPVIDTVVRDYAKAYIEANPHPTRVDYLSSTFEARLEIYNRQQHLTINPKGLEGLATHTRALLRDTDDTCFVAYQNGIVRITEAGAELHPYTLLEERCVWKSQVLERHFDAQANGNDCHFAQFINNVTNGEEDRLRAFRSAIGYLLHHYGNPAEGQAVICYDEEITDARKPEGGTGKGLFGNALRQIRPVAVLDGKKFDPNDRFCFQQVSEDTAVVWIDDPTVNHPKIERRFSLERFFSLTTEGWAVEKKHEHAFRIPAKEGPKLLISSNVVMSNEGSSNVRRQFVLEFSNHYKKQIKRGNERPIQDEHNCIFFSEDWDTTEWQRFDAYMIGCVVDYLREGLQTYSLHSADENRLRQTAGEDFFEWVTQYDGQGLVADTEYCRDTLWNSYRTFAGLGENERVTRGFTGNITQYAKGKGWKFERGKDTRSIKFRLTSCI